MDTQNLKAFVAVAQTGSFSQAADRLHLSQPAISKRIHLLEQQLDCTLFDRIGRRVSLTEAGRTLQPRAQAILAAIRDARQAIFDLGEQVSGELRIVTSHHIGLHRLPAVLRRFISEYPRVELEIQFENSQEAYESVLAGRFDLGVVTRSQRTDARIHSDMIWHDRLVFVVAADHPLSRKKSVSLKQLSELPALLPDAKFLTTSIVLDHFERAGLEPKIAMSTNYLETIKALISVGYGWSVLPQIMLNDASVVAIEVPGIELSRSLDCIHHVERSLSNPAACFLTLLQQQHSG